MDAYTLSRNKEDKKTISFTYSEGTADNAGDCKKEFKYLVFLDVFEESQESSETIQIDCKAEIELVLNKVLTDVAPDGDQLVALAQSALRDQMKPGLAFLWDWDGLEEKMTIMISGVDQAVLDNKSAIVKAAGAEIDALKASLVNVIANELSAAVAKANELDHTFSASDEYHYKTYCRNPADPGWNSFSIDDPAVENTSNGASVSVSLGPVSIDIGIDICVDVGVVVDGTEIVQHTKGAPTLIYYVKPELYYNVEADAEVGLGVKFKQGKGLTDTIPLGKKEGPFSISADGTPVLFQM